MKKKLLLFIITIVAIMSICAISASAATTSEFGKIETVDNIDLAGMNTETDKRIVIVDANGAYHTYPANYFVSNNTTFTYNFTPFKNATGITYTKHSVIRVEVPDNILEAGNCKDLSQTNNLEEIIFSKNSKLEKLNYGCFYANKKLKKVNIPASVKTIETLVINNSTLEELIFDDGFSAVLPKDSFKGASGVKRVVFSNQMTTVGDRALDDTLGTSLEEFYMGASLKDLGTNNMAWVKQSVKFYMPACFLSEADTITMETFSWWDSNACLPTGVIFFTGSKAQMEALIAKSTYDRVICSSAELVEWDSTKADDDYIPTSGWRIVYNYNTCEAFYEGEHDYQGTGLCVDGMLCENCQRNIPGTQGHSFKQTVEYANGYTEKGIYCNECVNEGCTKLDESRELAPIFGALAENGYSSNGTGIAFGGYTVNTDALKEFNDLSATDITYGVVIMNPKYVGDSFFTDGSANATKGFVVADMSASEYSNIKVMIDGLGANKSLELVIALYAYTDGADVEFIQSEDTNSACSSVEKTDATLYTVSLTSVVDKPNASVDALPPYENKENA